MQMVQKIIIVRQKMLGTIKYELNTFQTTKF